jgi:hypothetical protein
MDQRAVLRMTLLALEETIRLLASKGKSPSSAFVKQINSVLAEINKIVPGSHFAMFDPLSFPGPDPVELLSQIKLGLGIVGQDDTPTAEDQAPQGQQPTQAGAANVPGRTLRPEIFIGCSVEGLTEAKIIQLELAHSANTVIWSQGVFGLSRGTLETLVEKASSFTHAILVLTPDDMLTKRANESPDRLLHVTTYCLS